MNVSDLKERIKSLAKKQNEMKNQRKTVNFFGIRSTNPNEAFYLVWYNRNELRHLYEAYSMLRGKERQTFKNVSVKEDTINQLIEKYSS